MFFRAFLSRISRTVKSSPYLAPNINLTSGSSEIIRKSTVSWCVYVFGIGIGKKIYSVSLDLPFILVFTLNMLCTLNFKTSLKPVFSANTKNHIFLLKILRWCLAIPSKISQRSCKILVNKGDQNGMT